MLKLSGSVALRLLSVSRIGFNFEIDKLQIHLFVNYDLLLFECLPFVVWREQKLIHI